MQAPSRETVARITTDAAKRTLGFDMCVFRLYDADERELVPVASTNATTEEMSERPAYGLNEGPVGEVFVSVEPAIYDDVQTYDDEHDRSPVKSVMYFPIGVHGALSIGTTEEGAFDDADEQIATLLATNAAAACNRAKREREVRDARERIATIVERINGLVEDTIEVLVKATTREEVEQGVCEQLAGADPYVYAWIARPEVRGGSLTASEWAGDADFDVDGAELAIGGGGPSVDAFAEDESRVVDGEAMDAAASAQSWLAEARTAGVESLMAVPLSYRGGGYGVLLVCSDRPDAFDERERVVLEALGRAVANAINTVESGRILEADTVIELSIAIGGGQLLPGRLSAATGADLTSAGTMTQDESGLRLFLTATGAAGDDVADALAADDAVEAATLVAEHEGECLFDVSVAAPLIATLVDHGAVPKAIAAEDGTTRLTVELPSETAAREAFAMVEDRYPNAELVGYHERERPVQTQQEFRAALSDRFTDRQETALRTAYLGGFFDSPRGADGDELATGMDISRPTYHQHLRAAQRKVFEELFEAGGA
jgi:GAF domain-containing protein